VYHARQGVRSYVDVTFKAMSILTSPIPPSGQASQQKGWVVSLVTHILILALFCVPFILYHAPEPVSEGLLVSLGLPDEGQGDEVPKGDNAEPVPAAEQTKVNLEQTPQPVQPAAMKAQPVKSSPVVSSQADSPVTTRESEADRKAAADARARAEAEARQQAAYNQTKKSYGDLLGTGGKGNTGKPGSQGDPNGDPNSNILEGISNGSGRVGGGLGSRGVLHEPRIEDRSQKTGRVVISVCVDKKGKVIRAEYTQKGSTTTDSELREIARKAALQFTFTESEIVEQCGTITVDFKVRG